MKMRLTLTLTALGLLGYTCWAFAQNKPASTRKAAAKPAVAAKGASKRAALTPVQDLQGYMKVMEAELKRNWAWMQKRKKPRPYYLLCAMQRKNSTLLAARDGVIARVANAKAKPSYRLQVRLRVGDHTLDNTGRDGYDWRAMRHMLPVPFTLPSKPDAATLQKHLWQITDRRFQEGMAMYHRKRYVRSLKVEIKDKSGDFTKQKPVRLIDAPPAITFDLKKWKAIARRVSAFSKTNSHIVNSGVGIGVRQDAQAMLDSDGMRIIKHKTLYFYTVSITYLSPKREYLDNMRISYVDAESKLPTEAGLTKVLQKTLKELIDQGAANEGKPSEAPAILMPDVAGVLFHEALGHRLEAQRMLNESDGRTFRRKIGMNVIPTFLSIFDDPTLRYWRNVPLNGHYLVDDQGVKSSRVTLIDKGTLRGFLMSRKPIDKFKSSNAHGRALFGRPPFSRMGNLLVESTRQFSPAVLREMLIKETRRQGKPFAYIMTRASGGYTHTGTYGIQSFKNRPIVVYQVDAKTGKQTLVKGLEMIGTPLTVVNNIMATGNDFGIFNGYCGAESGYVPVSAIAPSVLLKTVEMQRVKIGQKKDHLLHPPYAEPRRAAPPKAAKAAKPAKAVKAVKAAKVVEAPKAPKAATKAPATSRPTPAR